MYSMQIEHQRVQVFPVGPSLTKQAFRKECDINQIMKQYKKNGLLDHLNTHQGNYGDFLNFEDYHASLNKILEAKDAFNSIPAEIRAKFDNDPSQFMSFAQNEENHEELVKMGLSTPRKEAKAQEEEPRPPEAPPLSKTPTAAPEAAPQSAAKLPLAQSPH